MALFRAPSPVPESKKTFREQFEKLEAEFLALSRQIWSDYRVTFDKIKNAMLEKYFEETDVVVKDMDILQSDPFLIILKRLAQIQMELTVELTSIATLNMNKNELLIPKKLTGSIFVIMTFVERRNGVVHEAVPASAGCR